MRFGSVCSGIEAASVAWGPLGWKAAWLSEIEPFPSAVLAHHYPDVPNLGDMTTLPERILSGEVEAPDVFCGGTPCQAFSVAGLRNSLDDARGNLSLTFVGIANAIDHVRSVRGEPASIVFWENVPGVLSTKDNAFGCFLAGIAGEINPVEPPGGKWTNAGYVLGPKRAVAWRLLDAQYFGVAQRRKRVFVVASARADFDPAAVLFEFDGVRRDTAPSRETGQDSAGGIRTGAAVSSHWDGDYPHPTLNQSAKSSGGVGSSNQEIFSQRGAYLAPQPIAARMVAFGEYSVDGTAMKARDYKDATDLVAQPITYGIRTANTSSNGWGIQEEVTHTLDCAQGIAIAQPMPINTMVALRHEALGEGTGFGIGAAGDPAYTLTKGHSHAVAHVVGALACNTGPNGHDAGNFACNQAVDAGHVLPAAQPMVLMDQGGSVMNVEHDMVGTLRRETHGHEPAVIQPPSMAVRRLTPVECERLQGFPDNYTNIPWRKKDESPDGPRYKALGNSWAVPNVRWIGQRIQENLK
jgi:site-specific DNA-cytosine methylase